MTTMRISDTYVTMATRPSLSSLPNMVKPFVLLGFNFVLEHTS